MTRTLRVALLGVRVQVRRGMSWEAGTHQAGFAVRAIMHLGLTMQEARRYHVSIQALAPGQAPIGVVVLNDMTSDQYRPDQVSVQPFQRDKASFTSASAADDRWPAHSPRCLHAITTHGAPTPMRQARHTSDGMPQ